MILDIWTSDWFFSLEIEIKNYLVVENLFQEIKLDKNKRFIKIFENDK